MSTPPTDPHRLEAPVLSHATHTLPVVLVIMTATSIRHIVTSFSVEARLKGLRKLLLETEKKYEDSVDALLAEIPDAYTTRPEFSEKTLNKGRRLIKG